MNTTLETTENAIKKFENIKESIKGIYDILKITAPSDNDIYFQLGVDNIIALYNNILDLISNNNAVKQINKKLENSESLADLLLGNLRLRNNERVKV